MTTHSVTRRDFTVKAGAIGAMLGLGGATSFSMRAHAQAAMPDLPLRDAYRRLRFGVGEEVVWWWLSGVKYGRDENHLKPLFGMEIVTLTQFGGYTDDGVIAKSLELVGKTDLTTGEPLTRLRNIYTGEDRVVDHTPFGPSRTSHNAAGPRAVDALPGAQIDRLEGSLTRMDGADDVFLSEKISVEVKRKAGRPFVVNDHATYRAPRAALAQADGWVPCTIDFIALTGWQSWYGMGDADGGMYSRAFGAKVAAPDEIPARTRDVVQAVAPDMLTDPKRMLAAPKFKFER